jgi:hypothetical protein
MIDRSIDHRLQEDGRVDPLKMIGYAYRMGIMIVFSGCLKMALCIHRSLLVMLYGVAGMVG